MSSPKSLVLVSGASGYLGSHCIEALLNEGYRVRGTVRSLKNAKKVDPIRALDSDNKLELVEADLMQPDSWPKVMHGIDYVLHVASPVVLNADSKTIKTAVEGTMNVLRAASEQPSVKKVVLTSSVNAIIDGVDWKARTYDESCWSVPENSKDDYSRSKTFAEKAAWEFHDSLPKDSRFSLTTINPSLLIGPLLINEEGTSALLVKQILEHAYPMLPTLKIGLVDVRDVAEAHVKALKVPASNNQRIILSAKTIWYQDIAGTLGKEFEPQGFKTGAMTAPCVAIWVMSFFDKSAKIILPNVGKDLQLDNSKSKTLLGLKYRDTEKSLVEMAYSLIERGIVKRTNKYKGVPFDAKLP